MQESLLLWFWRSFCVRVRLVLYGLRRNKLLPSFWGCALSIDANFVVWGELCVVWCLFEVAHVV